MKCGKVCRDWSMGLRDGDNSASNSLHHCVRSHHHHQLGVLQVAQCHARLSYWIPRCPSQPCSPLPAVIVNLIGTSPKHSTLGTGEHSGRDWRNIFTTFPLEFSCSKSVSAQVKLCMNLCAISWRLLLVTQTSGIFDTMMFGLVKVTLDTACDMIPPSIDGEYDDDQMETMETALLSPHHLSTVP